LSAVAAAQAPTPVSNPVKAAERGNLDPTRAMMMRHGEAI